MDQFMRYAGVEVINTERLQTYLDNGITPPGGVTFDVPRCEGLSEVLYPGTEFTTPLGDEPPWYDADDSDTWDFAGVLPLSVTGLDSTTRTVSVTQTVKGDGLAGQAIRGPQTIGVTAVLVGRTSEGVQAGLAWLRRVLHGACDAAEQPCGPRGSLETFTVCPTPVIGGVDLNTPVLWVNNDPNDASPGTWVALNGEFIENGMPGTLFRPFSSLDIIDGGDAPEAPDVIDGGDAPESPDVIISGESLVIEEGTLGGDLAGCTAGTVTVSWLLRAPEGTTSTVRLVLLDDSNTPIEEGPTYVITDVATAYDWEFPLGVSYEAWRPAFVTTDSVVVLSVTISTFDSLSPDECIAPYRRFFPVTTTVSGPTPVEVLDAECVEMLRVEWTWVSGSPYRYGVTDPVLLGMGWGQSPTLAAPGVTYDEGDGVTLTDATPWDCDPAAPVASCATDPAAPAIGTPPAAPVITDTTRPRITTEDVRDMWALIGPERVPANEGVLTIDLTAGADPVVGIRVRVWDDADGTGTVPDLCDFAYEFLIDYIPANGVLTIDGTAGTITTLCDGNTVPQDAAAGVRGAFGGPIEDPVVRCDRRYLVRVQWLDTYPRTAAPYYTLGDPNGDLTIDLSITPREG